MQVGIIKSHYFDKYKENRPYWRGFETCHHYTRRLLSRSFKSFSVLPINIYIQLHLFRKCMENDRQSLLFAINYSLVAGISEREQRNFALRMLAEKHLHRNNFLMFCDFFHSQTSRQVDSKSCDA